MPVRKLIKCLLSGIKRNSRTNERGLSTLEWILLVAAVGGLATIGVIVVRGAVDETDDRAQSQAELAGETGALRVLQGKVNEIMAGSRTTSTWGTDLERFNACLGRIDLVTHARQQDVARLIATLREKHSELYSFHPVSIDWDTASKPELRIAYKSDIKVVWCRVRHKLTKVCASIADETPVSDPPNDGYRDTNKYRVTGLFNNGQGIPPNETHSFPLSNTLCKGRV